MVDSVVTDRESLLVELVDESGTTIGSCSVSRAHQPPGQPHRAFSVLLFDESGRILLQRRAAVKTRFPSRWSNACCGHPAPGQTIAQGAALRLVDELGITVALTEVGVYRYRAEDLATDRVEDEWDHVLVGIVVGETIQPNPAEVSEYAWVEPVDLDAALIASPQNYTPWLVGVLAAAASPKARVSEGGVWVGPT
ncbi:isopentenyl-diphosphate Delta-isomerase [Nocardia salmonicida]|uniref:isopentenyl-diphosphate Delta-isomerase n=1 Tax=Nocardia salmonicida TaxID=53431 RepID=UPI0007A3C726|nr:isopentenyl-diphosphate Delta-isomerase [Nocardia salmonicida]